MNVKKLTQLSLLTAAALIIFIVEVRIPNIIPIPGVKLGLANIITVYAVYGYHASEVCMIVMVRILLCSIFSGTPVSLIYSVCGAMCWLCGMLLIKRIIPASHIWLASPIGAVFHNIGQILAAVLVMQTTAVFVYLPILMISGIISGLFTGICAQVLVKRI